MNNYQGNSNKSKENQKRVEKPVVKKRARVKKKNFVLRMLDMLIVEDAKDHALEDLVIPTINNAIMSITGYFFGGKKVGTGSKTSYGKYYKEKDGGVPNRNFRARTFNYDDVLLDDRSEAEAVIRGMEEILQTYPIVRVSDLYELAGVPTDNWTANKYGWTDVRNARIIRVSDGYLLRMPKPMPID